MSIERETFPAMVADGTLYALGSDAYWLDTGTPDAYLRAHRDLLLGRRPGPPSPDAEPDPSIGPGVWRIGDGGRPEHGGGPLAVRPRCVGGRTTPSSRTR